MMQTHVQKMKLAVLTSFVAAAVLAGRAVFGSEVDYPVPKVLANADEIDS